MRFSLLWLLAHTSRAPVPAQPECTAVTGCYCGDPLAENFDGGTANPAGDTQGTIRATQCRLLLPSHTTCMLLTRIRSLAY